MIQGADHADHKDFYLETLRDIVSQPTAPFREERVAARIGALLRAWDIPFVVDPTGNIIAHYRRGAPCRPLILMAHMDHPAFAVVARDDVSPGRLTAQLQGGVAARCFERVVPVRVYPRADGAALRGRVVGYRRGAGPREVELDVAMDDPRAAADVVPGDFGVWDLPDFDLRDGLIHARVADDLVGCAAALLTLWSLAREGSGADVYGVFTRAEEVGLVGARAVMRGGLLLREGYVVSLEASKALPGALQGAGPVIRVGDRLTTFGDEAELVLKAAAEEMGSNIWHPALPATVGVQRQLMSGGQCEASAAASLGYSATGLAFPLGNYHNVSDTFGVEAETVHVDDYLTGVALLQRAARLMPDEPRLRREAAAAPQRQDHLVARLEESAEAIQRAAHGA